MTTSAERPTLRIRTIDDLVAIIPRLLGFQPRESLALVVVDHGRLRVTARLDLAGCTPDHVAHQLGVLWERHPDALFLVVAYSADAAAAWQGLDTLAAAAPATLALCRFHADGERWFDHPEAVGVPYDPGSGVLVAQAVAEGMAVLTSREELAASLDPAATPRQVHRALRAVSRRRLGAEGLIREALRLVAAADAGESAVGLEDAAVLALASHDLAFREAAILSTSRSNAAARVGLWREVVRGSVPSCAGYALVVLALAAWVSGQGALQVVCMERAQGLATDRAWLDFLEEVNRHVVHPDEWGQLRADWYCDQLEGVVAGVAEEAG